MWRGISLANKCLLLFGGAVVLIIVAALAVASFRLYSIVEEGHRDSVRQLALSWEKLVSAKAAAGQETAPGTATEVAGATIVLLDPDQVRDRTAAIRGAPPPSPPAGSAPATSAPETDLTLTRFLARAWDTFSKDPAAVEYHSARWSGADRTERYAKAVRGPDGSLRGLVLLTQPTPGAAAQLLYNTVYLVSAGLISLGLAVLVFYLITNRLILSPVRELRETAERVRQGNLDIRSSIDTGDEFEELSDTFNEMLAALQASSDQLRAINKSLDSRLGELAERNLALNEANRLKGEFVANVSHELRTPLNSIIGFAELLDEIAGREAEAGDDSTRLAKRRRYLEHITTAGRSLLEMINSLLEMAKLEAGKTELHLEPVSAGDACEGLAAMMRPLADKSGVELSVEIAPDLPLVETDSKKLQQILYNFLSNAIKFTGGPAKAGAGADDGAPAATPATTADNGDAPPATQSPSGRPAKVTLRAERLIGRASEGLGAEDRVRICVIDTGPGIAPEDLGTIFEKFRQLESGLTRRHAGTGLGLAISKELASLIQAEIAVESEVGRGSMFSLILPLRVDPARAAEMRLETAFRGSLAAQRKTPMPAPAPAATAEVD